jgi:hypothetical protein
MKMSKKVKAQKKEKPHKKLLLKNLKIAENCKSKCCKKYKDNEEKRCKRCPIFDLLKKVKEKNL